MNIRWRYGIAFPLILAAALGGLSAWLGRISHIETEEVKLNPNEPQYWMDGIEGKRFDLEGRLKENFTAGFASQLPESKDVHLRMPKLEVYENGKLMYQVESKEGLYNTDTKQAVFEKEVVMTKEADDKQPAGFLKTELIHIDTATQFARTDRAVTYGYGRSHGTAEGMTYDNKKGLFNFPSKVKATIYDVNDF